MFLCEIVFCQEFPRVSSGFLFLNACSLIKIKTLQYFQKKGIISFGPYFSMQFYRPQEELQYQIWNKDKFLPECQLIQSSVKLCSAIEFFHHLQQFEDNQFNETSVYLTMSQKPKQLCAFDNYLVNVIFNYIFCERGLIFDLSRLVLKTREEVLTLMEIHSGVSIIHSHSTPQIKWIYSLSLDAVSFLYCWLIHIHSNIQRT